MNTPALHPAGRRTLAAFVALAVAAQGVLLADIPAVWQTAALWVWAVLVPGWLLVALLVGRSQSPPGWGESLVYAVGAGYGCLVGMMLVLSFVPGPLLSAYLALGVDGLIIVLGVATAFQRGPSVPVATGRVSRWTWTGLLLLLAVGGMLRLLHLGYAEFHGDEARAVLRAAAVIQGYDGVLLLHKKGPAEILLPAAVFAASGRLTEASVRLPFALAGLTALGAVWLLGRRLFGPGTLGTLAGWAAAMLLALDGYFVAFSRIVQYQSLVILMSALVLLVLARLLAQPEAARGYLTLAALFFATGLWAHYEGALVAAPALYLAAVLLRQQHRQRHELVRGFGIAAAVSLGLLALFYLPFVLSPQFGATYTYLVERRIGGEGFPTNNLADYFTRSTLYSSTYAVVLWVGLAAAALVAVYRRSLGPRLAMLAGLLLVAGLLLMCWRPEWLSVGGRDWLVLFFVLALLPAWLLRGTPPGERSLWIWFGLGWVGMLFFTAKPRTHVYVFLTPWALLAGLALGRGWGWLRERAGLRRATWAGAAAALLLTVLFGVYVYLLFAYTRVEVLRTWDEHWPAGYWTVYDRPDNRALFGFPLANGWKTVGMLYQTGQITGDYATNEVEYWTPLWYTRGRLRCDDRASWFFQIDNPQPDPAAYRQALAAQIAQQYRPWGVVTVGGDPRMVIHWRGEEEPALRRFPLEEVAPAFDAQATAGLPLGYPVVEPPIAHPLHVNFDNQIWLEGYALEYAPPLEPGDSFRLTLFWRAQQPVDASYKVFNQAYYGNGVMVAQQDGYPVCGSRGTWLWDPDELIADVHTLTVQADAPSGLYPLFTGLYLEETLERLTILDDQGAPAGDQVHLTDIRIGAE